MLSRSHLLLRTHYSPQQQQTPRYASLFSETLMSHHGWDVSTGAL